MKTYFRGARVLRRFIALIALTALSTFSVIIITNLHIRTSHLLPTHHQAVIRSCINQFRALASVNASLASFSDDAQNARHLLDDVLLPPAIVSRLSPATRRDLLLRLTSHTSGRLHPTSSLPKLLIVDVQNGLGNRLRALASGLQVAYESHRIPLFVWAPDAHSNATLRDLFHSDVLRSLLVCNHEINWPVDANDVFVRADTPSVLSVEPNHASLSSVDYVTLMGKDVNFSRFYHPNPCHQDRHFYVRSAYVLPPNLTSKCRRVGRSSQDRFGLSQPPAVSLENAFLQTMAAHPAPAVKRLLDVAVQNAGGSCALQARLGVHMRARVSTNDSVLGVDPRCEYSVTGARLSDSFRKRSSPTAFAWEMRRAQRMWPRIVDTSVGLERAKQRGDVLLPFACGEGSGEGTDAVFKAVRINVGVAPRFYVAADSQRAILELREVLFPSERTPNNATGPNKRLLYGEPLAFLPRECEDRSRQCTQAALADMIALSRTAGMLTSGWSSFSELTGRVRVRLPLMDPGRNDGYFVRVSGYHFGKESFLNRIWVACWELAEWGLAAVLSRGNGDEQKRRLRFCQETNRRR